jgi:uncharacterized protein YggE
MRFLFLFLLFAVALSQAQSSVIDITGDAAVNVAPDRVTLNLGAESRNKVLSAAISQNDAIVRKVLQTARGFHVEEGDIQTEDIHVELQYQQGNPTVIDFYDVTKGIAIFLRDVSKFEPILAALLEAGANHIYDVQFSTSELRKYRDQARAVAVKAAIEKASDLAAAAGMHVSGKPLGLSSYNYGGGSWYGLCCGNRYGSQWSQNVVQNVGSGGSFGPAGAIALGKISVTASVTMRFSIE